MFTKSRGGVTRILGRIMGVCSFYLLFLAFGTLELAKSQSMVIKGVVTDMNDSFLIGASVVFNEGEVSRITDSKGEFEAEVLSDRTFSLQVSFLGYEPLDTVVSVLEDNKIIRIRLKPEPKVIDKVFVSGNARSGILKSQSISVNLITEEFMKENQAGSLMQTLGKIPGVNSMDIGSGLSKPMIRGMGYYRVCFAKNGIKQEGQQWSSHHGLAVDQNAVKHVEVLKGPASLRFGSDAIGGVINILSEHVPIQQGVTGNIASTLKTNNEFVGTSGEISVRKGDVFMHVDLTQNFFRDFKVPLTDSFLFPAPGGMEFEEFSHKYELGDRVFNTAGNEQAAGLTVGIVRTWGKSSVEFTYYRAKTGFFDWLTAANDSIRDRHTAKRFDIKFPHQEVNNFSLYHFSNIYFDKNKLEIAMGYQRNISGEFNYLTDITGDRSADLRKYREKDHLDLQFNLMTMSGNVTYTINNPDGYKITTGVSGQYQQQTVDGYSHLLPAYKRFMGGAFLTGLYEFTSEWTLVSGIRGEYGYYKMEESVNPDPKIGKAVFNSRFEKRYPVLAFSGGVNFAPGSRTLIKLNVGRSFRFPSAYELGAGGFHRHEARYESGADSLDPELAWQFDLGFEKKWVNAEIGISPFVNYFSNYIYLQPTPDFVKGTYTGQLYLYRQNAAVLCGGELNAGFDVGEFIHLNTALEYVYAANLDLREAIPSTPPLSLMTGVHCTPKDRKYFTENRAGIDVVWTAAQDYVVLNELPTPSYTRFDLLVKTKINWLKNGVNIIMKVRNLLNTRYYNHLSFYRRLRIPEPGRDIQLYLEVPF